MFGVALGIKLDISSNYIHKQKQLWLAYSHNFLLPAITFLLVLVIKPTPTVALGMILVPSCPGGNISNFIYVLGKGNAALSVSLTAFSSLAAIIMTPLNFELWGRFYNAASNAYWPIEIEPMSMFQTVFIILSIPLVAGMLFSYRFPGLTYKIIKPLKIASIFIFLGYVVIALMNNIEYFLSFIHLIILLVLAHNALALLTGYSVASIFSLAPADKRALTIETGIQNSGLALVLIFNPKIFPVDLEIGGMAIIAA